MGFRLRVRDKINLKVVVSCINACRKINLVKEINHRSCVRENLLKVIWSGTNIRGNDQVGVKVL